jgi:multidrug efflux pump subunit AcrA (membrane-fusion protein)
MRRSPAILAAAVVSVLTGLAAPACSGKAASKGAGEGPRRVQVVKAERRKIPRTVVAVGTLAAEERAELGFKVAGRLARWDVDLGSLAKAGAPLAELDATDYVLRRDRARAALEQVRSRLGLPVGGDSDDIDPQDVGIVRQAKARLEQASVNLDRSRELRDQGILAQADFDATEAAFKVAQSLYNDALEEVNNRRALLAERRSDLALAEQQLTDTRLLAPFSGAVQQPRANLGENLAAGAPVLTLVKLTPLRLRVDVPEREASNVRRGQDVTVRVEGTAEGWPGKIVRLAPALEESNRSLIVEAEVDNSKGLIRPGSFARAEIVTEAGVDSLVVPSSSVVVFAGIEKVVTVKDGKALEKPVTTGRHTGEAIEILAGLEAGEPVVVKPGNLATGVAVDVSGGQAPAS